MLWAIGCAYIGLLGALVLVTLRQGEPMRRTALTIFAVMLIAYAWSFTLGGGTDYSVFMVIINGLAAGIVLKHWAGRWQAAIGASFILQIGTDTGRVASDIYFGASDMYFVYWQTTVLAYAQLVLLAGWFVDERTGYFSRFTHNLPASEARRGGLA